MVTLTALWLPILVASVLVFIVSSIIHVALTYHRSDFKGIPEEDPVREALRKQNLAPGQYMFPYCADMKDMKKPEVVKKYQEGPVGILTVMRSGQIQMGPLLLQWFLFSVLISIMAAYVAGRTLQSGAEYLAVFRVTGTVAWLGYAGSTISSGIWQGRPWSTVLKDVFDGLVYALVSAGAFGWLWPR